MGKRIILLISSLAVIVGLMSTGTSYAWFTTTAKKKQSVSISMVSSVHSAHLADIKAPYHTIIMPGDNLVSLDGKPAMLQLDNQSTTDMQMRISIEYTSYKDGTEHKVIYSADPEKDDINVEFASNLWAKNVSSNGTCYFYYMGDRYSGDTVLALNDIPAIAPSVASIPAISSIAYNTDITSAYSGKPVNVKVVFESKQADNITWAAIDSYEVSGVNE